MVVGRPTESAFGDASCGGSEPPRSWSSVKGAGSQTGGTVPFRASLAVGRRFARAAHSGGPRLGTCGDAGPQLSSVLAGSSPTFPPDALAVATTGTTKNPRVTPRLGQRAR